MLVPLDRWHLKVKLSLALKSKGVLYSFLSEPAGKSIQAVRVTYGFGGLM